MYLFSSIDELAEAGSREGAALIHQRGLLNTRRRNNHWKYNIELAEPTILRAMATHLLDKCIDMIDDIPRISLSLTLEFLSWI